MTRDPAPPTILIVSHTHWDREWYHPAVRFRQRLVPLVDELLGRPPDEPPFLLDGQVIVLEDYLAVRPGARERIGAAVRTGRLEAGPWYVLADELIPGGEALVRNLLAGRRILADLGGNAPPVLYSPDAFGHPAALPLLATEFGCPLIILWRGLGGALWPDGDAFRWSAPDGSTTLVYHLPPDGYEFGSNLPADASAARARWQELERTAVSRARLGATLLMNGADHHAPQRDLPAAVHALAAAARPTIVRQVALGEAARDLASRASGVDLPALQGELRASYGHAWSLQGTFGVRAMLKRRAARLERALVRDVEPWLALTRSRDGAPAPELEHAAWATLLRCHPHDTLCGCSIDAVGRAMAARLEAGEAQADGLRADALQVLLGHDPDAASGRSHAWTPAMVVRNRSPRVRSGVAELELVEFIRDVPVGPGSAFAEPPRAAEQPLRIGNGVPYQRLESGERIERLEPRRRYPDADLVRVRQVVAWIRDVPPYGVMPLPIVAGTTDPARGSATGHAQPDGRLTLSNEHLQLSVESGGVPSLQNAAEDRIVRRLIELEDIGDAGDTYTPSLVGPEIRVASVDEARVVHDGPLRAELGLHYAVAVPASSDRGGRAGATRLQRLHLSCILDAGAPFLRIRVRGENTARDHRLRLVLDGGTGPGAVWADAAFGPVRREPVTVPAPLARLEAPLPTAPLHRYVSVFGSAAGFTVYADGLTEYEALPDGRIAVTLVRAVGELSRPDLPERPGHAGWPAPTPEAQCLGPLECELAILLHGQRDAATVDLIERIADDVLLPLAGHTVRQLLSVPEPVDGIALDGAGLAFGACKRSETGEWTVLRCVNLLDREAPGRWTLPWAPAEARRSRLDESTGAAVPVEGRSILFTVAPRGVLTLLVR